MSFASETLLGEGAHRQRPLRHQLERGESRKKKVRKKKALQAARVPENSDIGQEVFTAHPAREVKTGKSTNVGKVTASKWGGNRTGPEQGCQR